MKKIKLTNSKKCATVDDEDFQYINQWNWFLKREGNMEYAARSFIIDGQEHIIYMHNEVMELNARRE